GLLDRAKFEPAVRKAWTALVACVAADGKLTHVQPIGADPKKFAEDGTEVYGVGAFLLAGSEVYRLAVFKGAKPKAVKVSNPAKFRREGETVEIAAGSSITTDSNLFGAMKEIAVMDGIGTRILDSQTYWEPSD